MAYCSDCGRQLSDRAVSCPQCGAPGPGSRTATTIAGRAPIPPGLELASWGARLGAYLLDLLIVSVPLAVLMLGFLGAMLSDSSDAGIGFGSLFVAWMILSALYKPLMEGARGQTLGKMVVKIRVVDAGTGAPCGYGKAFLRWLVGLICNIVPGGALIDGLWPLWDERRQALHDKVGTLVVRA